VWRKNKWHWVFQPIKGALVDTPWRNLIDFKKSQIYLNPALSTQLKNSFQNLADLHSQSTQKTSVWILSSGTSSINQNYYKLIGLSHNALLSSAKAVNEHLKADQSDLWLNVLPLFHVGGLSILYRSHLLNNDCYNLWNPQFKWNPHLFKRHLAETNSTLSSLVPTQVYDLVKENILPPSNLRAIIVGGAHLNPDLYFKARKMGWPLLPSFGMTEAASQIATASLSSLEFFGTSSLQIENSIQYPELEILNHVQVKVNSNLNISIKGPSLLDGYYQIAEGSTPVWHTSIDENGWFATQDCGKINENNLSILSRTDELIKVRGELVNLADLRSQLDTLCTQNSFNFECTITALPDVRLGYKLALIGNASAEELEKVVKIFNSRVLPFEKLSEFFENIKIPRNNLGKILHSQLVQKLQS
jgi:O-succinylbenzoic acid--CoA ligase